MLSQYRNHFLNDRFEHNLTIKAEIVKFALRESVEGAFGCEQVDGIVFAPSGRSPGLCPEVGHDVQLPPALLSIKTPHLGIRENQFEQRDSQSAPPCMKIYGKGNKAASNVFRRTPGRQFGCDRLPFRSDPGFISSKKDLALVLEMLIKGARRIASFL